MVKAGSRSAEVNRPPEEGPASWDHLGCEAEGADEGEELPLGAAGPGWLTRSAGSGVGPAACQGGGGPREKRSRGECRGIQGRSLGPPVCPRQRDTES